MADSPNWVNNLTTSVVTGSSLPCKAALSIGDCGSQDRIEAAALLLLPGWQPPTPDQAPDRSLSADGLLRRRPLQVSHHVPAPGAARLGKLRMFRSSNTAIFHSSFFNE
jgi:hypothetical protein